MLKVQVLFEIFTNIFRIFGFWPDRSCSRIKKCLFFGYFAAFVLLSIGLIFLKLLTAGNVEELVLGMFFLMGYCYTVGSISGVWYHRDLLDDLMSLITESIDNDELAVPFLSATVHKSKVMASIIMTWTAFVLNFGIILVPAVMDSLPIPMWMPDFLDLDTSFGAYWIFQILSVNYTIGNVGIFVYMCVLLMVINGYAEYLSWKLRNLVSRKDYSGYLELVDCIQAHRNLKM